MARIGVTGHVSLSADSVEPVYRLLLRALRRHAGPDLHGVTCLARGADRVFARAVLALGGTFEVVLPALDYRERVVPPTERGEFDDLLDQASQVSCMRFAQSSRDAYVAASEELLRRSDLLLAVWDGQPSRRRGDTADVVRTARRWRLPVSVLWPRGAQRERPVRARV
ncbi:MAG TPA: hypothetical protein VFC00_06465 [Micromonosporaceae bacterium]|nr:hypothetical protein [Micromonosporaceae bacterium]